MHENSAVRTKNIFALTKSNASKTLFPKILTSERALLLKIQGIFPKIKIEMSVKFVAPTCEILKFSSM